MRGASSARIVATFPYAASGDLQRQLSMRLGQRLPSEAQFLLFTVRTAHLFPMCPVHTLHQRGEGRRLSRCWGSWVEHPRTYLAEISQLTLPPIAW
jgi:hypothetical protein